MNNDRRQGNLYLIYIQIGILCIPLSIEISPAIAQITPDRTLGTNSSVVKQVTPQLERIDGGAVSGNNLFHSFSDFNIGDGNRADFINPAGITNIFSRVTGNNPSLLFGTLGVLGNANLFFLNPQGMVFGQNAKLDLSGAFVATTANSFQFGTGGSFGTIDPTKLPVLSIDTPVPISLQFASSVPGSIVNSGNLATKPGQSLILAGGTIASPGTLTADGGQIALVTGTDPNAQIVQAGTGQPVSVVFAPQSNVGAGLALPALVSQAGSNTSLVVNVDRSVQVGKTTQIVKPGDILFNQIDSSSNNKDGRNGGGVLVNASGQIQGSGWIDASSYYGSGAGGRVDLISPAGLTLDKIDNTLSCGGGSKCAVYSETSGAGTGGAVNIRTRNLTLANSVRIGTRARGLGNGGTLNLVVPDFIDLIGYAPNPTIYDSGLFAYCGGTCTGHSGDINIQTNRLIARDGGNVSTLTAGNGDAGNIRVKADTIELSGAPALGRESGLFAQSLNGGSAGNISIQTKKIAVANSAAIEASTSINSIGQAGNISIDATESVAITGIDPAAGSSTGIYTFTGNDKAAGSISINTPKLVMNGGASISAGTDGAGAGGVVRLNATESVEIVGSTANGNGTRLRSIASNAGNGGDIIINTPKLTVADGARIDNRTGTGSGNGGNIEVKAKQVEILSGGQLISSTAGKGQAGRIAIDLAGGDLTIAGSDFNYADKLTKFSSLIVNQGASSAIVTQANPGSTGKGGNIQIVRARNVNLSDLAQVTVNSQGTGVAGNIAIAAQNLTVDRGSKITAQTIATNGGNIRLEVGDLLKLKGSSEISTTAGTAQSGGNGGNISIFMPQGFVIADPAVGRSGNDITANAYTGNGGRVDLTAQGLLGLIFRPKLTALNDITASSAFGLGGLVQIDTPQIDPSRGLSVLPAATRTVGVAEGCQASSSEGRVAYFDVGRGGMPQSMSGGEAGIGAGWIEVGEGSQNVAGMSMFPMTRLGNGCGRR